MNKVLTVLFVVQFIVQSCTIYQKASVPLEDVINQGKVKVVNDAGQKFTFNKIEKEHNSLYGITNSDTIHIDSTTFSKVLVPDKRRSSDFKNRIYIGYGLLPHFFLLEQEYHYGFSVFNFNFEHSLNNFLNVRLNYGRSNAKFISKLGAYNSDYNEKEHASANRNYYAALLCLNTSGNNGHFEVNLGYVLIDTKAHEILIPDPANTGLTSVGVENRKIIHRPAIEIAYRRTLGPYIAKAGLSLPYGINISIGYGF